MEEAHVVVTAATGTLGPVVVKLGTLLRRRSGEYQLRRRTRKDVKLIRSKLESVHSILWVIWEKEDSDRAGKELRMEAWRLADDMNDAIDDFILTMKPSKDGKRSIQAKDQPSPFQDLKGRAVDVYERCRSKWKTIVSPFQDLKGRAVDVYERCHSKWKTIVDGSGLPKRHRVVDPYVHKDISELVGMEEPRDILVKHLVGEEESTPELKMASILGVAGMGKTTLARLVYEAIQDKFHARAFVSVILCRNMTEVLANILRQLAANSTDVLLAGTKAGTKNKHLINIISTFLKDKRYLVIIDDIWHIREWETVKESLPDNYLGSRIVTTSRVHAIADKWRDDFDALVHWVTGDRFEPAALTDKMIDNVGEDFDSHHPIVYMCGRTPLAFTCMLSALVKERERQEHQGLWLTHDLQERIMEQIMINGIQNTPGFEALVESLELGYNNLPHHMLKTCLLYLSIYPPLGFTFKKGYLFRRWITEGFVCKEEVANDYFDELVSWGFITGHSGRFGMHPMMGSYLRFKLRKDNFITFSSNIPSSPVGRLCIDYWPESSDTVETLLEIDWHHIRSLVVFKNPEKVPYKHLQHLRVLDVVGFYAYGLKNQLLKDMCGLRRLRHLLLSEVWDITEMPAEIARLHYLETLEVTGTKITRLPAEIGKLKQLKTLDVASSERLAELPRELGNLQHILETLCICGSEISEQAWEIIGKLKKLKTLDVSANRQLSGIPRVIGELQQLKNLDVSSTGITELPCQIGNLQQLQTLNLSAVGTIAKLPRDIVRLQHLKELRLSGTNVKKIPREIGGLKKLKTLAADIGTLPFEAGQLPKLEGLPECVQRAWKNTDLMSSLAGEILSFQTTDTNTPTGGLVVGTKHIHIPQWITEHFNNIGLLDIRICKLEEKDLKILRDMPNLYELRLRFEAIPKRPIPISGEGFAVLALLVIDSRVPRITFQEGAMPSLQVLTFVFQFYGGPPNTDPPMGIKHLLRLGYVCFECSEWYRGHSRCINATIKVVSKEAWEHPNRVTFQVSSTWASSEGGNEASSSGANEIEEIQA